MALFMQYDWPGNIRELKSAMEYAYVIAESGSIEPQHLPANILNSEKSNSRCTNPESVPIYNEDTDDALYGFFGFTLPIPHLIRQPQKFQTLNSQYSDTVSSYYPTSQVVV
ncbi:hypothetical protein ACFLZM_03475 [Thermodesulfobacteriota bacterium]